MAKKVITFWVEDELLVAIDELAQSMGYTNLDGTPNRSATIRHVLRRATGGAGAESVLSEEVLALHRKLRERAGPIAKRVREVILDELDLVESA